MKTLKLNFSTWTTELDLKIYTSTLRQKIPNCYSFWDVRVYVVTPRTLFTHAYAPHVSGTIILFVWYGISVKTRNDAGRSETQNFKLSNEIFCAGQSSVKCRWIKSLGILCSFIYALKCTKTLICWCYHLHNSLSKNIFFSGIASARCHVPHTNRLHR
jgi:hypothetical protein